MLGGADEVALAYGEVELGKMARKLGGKWVPDVKLWYIEYGRIKGTELEKHIVLDASKKNSGQCSIWEDHRFTRAREPVNKILEQKWRKNEFNKSLD